MAFVYRNTKETNNSRPQTPAPTKYNPKPAVSQIKNTAVSFVDRTNRQIWKASVNPGPGEYNSLGQKNMNNHHAFNKILSDNYCVVQDTDNNAKGCCSSFKSKSKRLDNNITQTPGPGYYQSASKSKIHSKTNKANKKPSQLARYLFQQARKEGFTNYMPFVDQNVNDLMIFDPSTEIIIDKKQQSEAKAFIKCKKMNAFSSKVGRTPLTRPTTSIGPGSYNVQKSFEAINRKNSSIVRQKPSISINQAANHYEKENIADFLKQSFQLMPEHIGPGAYNANCSSFNKQTPSDSKGISCFGSLQSRFTNKKNISDNQGNKTNFINSQFSTKIFSSSKSKKQVPFMSQTPKQSFQYHRRNLSNKNISIGLNSKTQADFQENIPKKNSKKGKLINSNFGSGSRKFRNASHIDKKQDKNESNSLFICPSNQDKQIDNIKRSHTKTKKQPEIEPWSKSSPKKADYENKMLDQRPLCYDSEVKTFKKNLGQKSQINAPFMAITQRFKSSNKNFQQQLLKEFEQKGKKDIQIVLTSKSSSGMKPRGKNLLKNYLQQTRLQESYTSNKKNHRIICEQKQNFENIGPQSYDPIYPKKGNTHNLLFKQTNRQVKSISANKYNNQFVYS